MDYEKKYNEALKWMRELYPGLHGATKEDAEHYFPELRESEDERIRTEIISALEFANDGGIYDKHIAYLEKQKEQKPNYCHHGVDETGWTEEYRKAYYDGWNNCNMQHEQLKADQKPAEWSEEDERNFYWISTTIQERHLTPEYTQQVHKILTWLESLRPQPSWKPSEEQMEAFRGYIEDFQARAEAAVGGWNNFDVMIRLYEQLKKL